MNTPKRTAKVSSKAFTLVELLTVIAVIGILAAIIIPTTGAVRTNAKKTQVRTMFSQWSSAFTLFKQEYGYYPNVHEDGTDNLISTTTADGDHAEFVRALTGKNINGTALGTSSTDVAKLKGNKRRQVFLTFDDTQLPSSGPNAGKLTDAFGNTEFGVVTDVNGDGVIKVGTGAATQDAASVPPVESAENPGTSFTPTTGAGTDKDIPNEGVRTGVIFYSAGKDGTVQGAVMSWK
jgi:prepilin-type N-terminal cleavage/methylation domain-containing protein